MRYSEKWGDSIDSAVDLALADLKLTREQVTVTVLEQPSKGFFGIGSRLAKVRVEEIEPPKPEKPAKPEVKENTEKPERPAKQQEKQVKKEDGLEIVIEKCGVDEEPRKSSRHRNKKRGRKPEKKVREAAVEDEYLFEEVKVLGERPEDLVEQEEHVAKTFLQDVAKEMGLKVNVKVSSNKDNVYVDIDGEDSGTIIGKRGSTLDALQYLTSLVVNKDQNNYIRVVIDAENYREKREKTLEKLAFRLADKALRSGRSVRLEPMNPYERKVIHTALQQRKGVTTRSEGEEPYRRVIIEPVK
ncbi:MAG: protein jag [Firmicutes bacterium]|jgi:spoIIIJ-associated protein|nr:protein jag [Bacillota bacterium]MBR6970708.1 protein jag [Bacillota bacterium]